MSSAASGLGTVFDIRASLTRFAADLRASEALAAQSARKVQGDAQRIANERTIVMRIRTEAMAGGNLDEEQRRRFAGTGVGTSAMDDKGPRSFLDTTIKIGLVLKTIQGAITTVQGLTHVWAANAAEAAGNHRKAADEMVKFAAAAVSLPLIGQMLDKLSGGAVEAAKGALADTDKINEKTATMVKDRLANEAALAQQAAVNRAQGLTGIEKEQQLEALRHAAAIKAIDDEVKAKKIGAGAAADAKAAENIATRERQRQISIDAEIAQVRGDTEFATSRIAATEPADQQQAMIEQVEFEQQLRIAELEAEKKGVDELAAQREINAQKTAARELELARRVEDEKLRLATERSEAEQRQREDLQAIRERHEQEEQEAVQVAEDAARKRESIEEQIAGLQQDVERQRLTPVESIAGSRAVLLNIMGGVDPTKDLGKTAKEQLAVLMQIRDKPPPAAVTV